MNMNGGTSTSATDPHHRASGYLGMGIPGLGATPMTPQTGNGFGGANMLGLGMTGGATGPELKHHADFLSRLLAATPSYPSDVGNPPPGFFSDWLRRLVSKPGPGNGNSSPNSHHPHHRGRGPPSPPRMSSPSGGGPNSTPTSIQQQTSSMTFSPGSGQPESNGVSPLESSTQHHQSGSGGGGNSQGGKRRKRTRISDHHLHLPHQQHHSGKDSTSAVVRESPSPLSSHLNHNQNSLVSSALTSTLSGSSSSSAAAVAAASLNPFTHPLWFFPPFLPNPYLSPMNMNMGMNIPGLLPPHVVPQSPPGSSGTPSYLGGSLGGNVGLPTSESLLSSFRTSTDNLLHAHHHHHRQFNSPPDLNLNSMKKDAGHGGGAAESKPPTKRGCGKGSKKSSSFSISRLTSPSPSSNSSGGSLTSKGSNNNNNNYNHPPQHHSGGGMLGESIGKTASLALGSGTEMMTRMPMVKASGGGRDKGTSDSGSETGASAAGGGGNCVDLRVSGRSWEKSGVSAPPPRSIYKPLSAFHDPGELNLAHSSQQGCSPDNFSLRDRATGGGRGTTKSLQEQQEEKMISGDHTNLSTTYVLKNLHHIYLRVKEWAGGSSKDSFSISQSTTTINNNTHHQSHGAMGSIHYKNHHHQLSPPTGKTTGVTSRKGNGRHCLFNYSPPSLDKMSTESNHPGSTSSQDLIPEDENKKEKEWKKVIDLADVSLLSAPPLQEIGEMGSKEKKNEAEIKIPLPRPIKAEPNYSSGVSGGMSGIKRPHDSTPNNPTSNLSFDDDEEEEPVELRPSKAYKYSSGSGKSTSVPITPEKSIPQSSDNEEDDDEEDGDGGSDDIVNVSEDETENEDEVRRSGERERKRIRNGRDSRGRRASSPSVE